MNFLVSHFTFQVSQTIYGIEIVGSEDTTHRRCTERCRQKDTEGLCSLINAFVRFRLQDNLHVRGYRGENLNLSEKESPLLEEKCRVLLGRFQGSVGRDTTYERKLTETGFNEIDERGSVSFHFNL